MSFIQLDEVGTIDVQCTVGKHILLFQHTQNILLYVYSERNVVLCINNELKG